MAKKSTKETDVSAEIAAIGIVHGALEPLNAEAQVRVLSYVGKMLNVFVEPGEPASAVTSQPAPETQSHQEKPLASPVSDSVPADADGINSVALRLMKRSGIEPKDLHGIFSLGIDEIDLVAPKVPGSSKRERFHNVLLLKGIASYLGTGTPKVAYEQLKEASLHYDAFDVANSAAHLKAFSADASGSKTAGYTLSPRGLTQGIAIVKSMIDSKKG